MADNKKNGLNLSDDAQQLKFASEAFTVGDYTCPECEYTEFEDISKTHVECNTCGYTMLKK